MQPLVNPVWHALTTEHASLALGTGLARRYPADVAPLAGLQENSAQALTALRGLLATHESIYVVADDSADHDAAGLDDLGALPCLQMIHQPEKARAQQTSNSPLSALNIQPAALPIQVLTERDAPAMVDLTDVAFPGFFRPRTYRMGNYYGIRADDQIAGPLLAMAGERLALPGLRELSGVCTHPDHTGQSYATRLIQHVLARHQSAAIGTFLHVSTTNLRAIELYESLGFVVSRNIALQRIRRK
jgi:ribosomal protein S18 acetylase RimI-like enzyme